MTQPSLFDENAKSGKNVQRVQAEVGTDRVRFDGDTYSPKWDDERLAGQMLRIFQLMRDAQWRTLQEISDATGDPAASISAQLRHFRKKKFGAHAVDKRTRGERGAGLYEYRLTVATR